MSMIGEYARLTPSELKRAIGDPEWIMDHIEQLGDMLDDAEIYPDEWDGSDDPPGRVKLYSTSRAWNLLAYLLERASFPAGVVYGEHVLDPEQDWGYGPASYLTPDRVKFAANALDATPYSQLVQGVVPDDLNDAKIYPMPWEDLGWGREYYEGLVSFFDSAAGAGDAILCWLD